MQLLEDPNIATYQIQSYQLGCIIINGQKYQQSLIIMPDRLITTWPVKNIADLSIDNIAAITAYAPKVILLGTGNQPSFIDPSLFQPLINLKIGMEVMHTAAACRTYTILAAEGRQVAAALII